jgi:hypothetical protein
MQKQLLLDLQVSKQHYCHFLQLKIALLYVSLMVIDLVTIIIYISFYFSYWDILLLQVFRSFFDLILSLNKQHLPSYLA